MMNSSVKHHSDVSRLSLIISGALRGSIFLIFITLSIFFNGICFGDTVAGKVTHVYDGDTFLLEDGTKVRLASIDTPEMGRDGRADSYYAREALSRLSEMVLGRNVRMETVVVDRYGRVIAWVYVSGVGFVNEKLVKEGAALFYKHKGNDIDLEQRLLAAQREAVLAGRGFWRRLFELPLSSDKWIGNKKSYRCFSVSSKAANMVGRHNRKVFKNLKQAVSVGYSPARNIRFWPTADN